MAEPEIDHVIAELEALTARLESAPLSELENELSAAVVTSSELLKTALPPDESATWQSLFDQALQLSSPVETANSSVTSARNVTETMSVTHLDRSRGQISNNCCQHCGQQLLEASSKGCIHGCKVSYCGVECRKIAHRDHVKECDELRRKRVMKRIGIAGGTDGEMF